MPTSLAAIAYDRKMMPGNPFWPRLLKKAQMQGGTPEAERGVLEVRRSEWRGASTLQMGIFQQPAEEVPCTSWS